VGASVTTTRSESIEIASVREAPSAQYADPVPTE
jgi:hypothetical protein